MKKVLFVATVVKTHIMTFHLEYLKWFKDNGYKTYVCAKNDYINKEDCNIPYCDEFIDIPFERSPFKLNNFKSYSKVREVIDANNFDIIHCHTPVGGAITRLAAKSKKGKSTKVFYTAHGFHFYRGGPLINWLVYYPIEKWLSRYTDVLITINKEDYNLAKRLNSVKTEYVPGVGIDTKKYINSIVDRENKRKELGIPEDAFLLISVGELNKNKNHSSIIKALSEIKDNNIYYIICGNGPLEHNLTDLILKYGLEDRVKLLGFRSDIDELTNISDLFVFPSFREGLSLALMEAMSSGLPIVCSKIRGNMDLVENESGGFLINPSDIQGFASAIEKVKQDNLLRESMAKINKTKIKMFDINNVKQIMGEVYLGRTNN